MDGWMDRRRRRRGGGRGNEGRGRRAGAWKSLCKALEHIATAFWPPCSWNATFCYTLLNEQGGTTGGFWSHVSMEPHNRTSTVPRFCPGKTEVFWGSSITGAWKSVCKALEHIATAFWPPCGWNATFCYTILSEQGAQRVDFGAR